MRARVVRRRHETTDDSRQITLTSLQFFSDSGIRQLRGGKFRKQPGQAWEWIALPTDRQTSIRKLTCNYSDGIVSPEPISLLEYVERTRGKRKTPESLVVLLGISLFAKMMFFVSVHVHPRGDKKYFI